MYCLCFYQDCYFSSYPVFITSLSTHAVMLQSTIKKIKSLTRISHPLMTMAVRACFRFTTLFAMNCTIFPLIQTLSGKKSTFSSLDWTQVLVQSYLSSQYLLSFLCGFSSQLTALTCFNFESENTYPIPFPIYNFLTVLFCFQKNVQSPWNIIQGASTSGLHPFFSLFLFP